MGPRHDCVGGPPNAKQPKTRSLASQHSPQSGPQVGSSPCNGPDPNSRSQMSPTTQPDPRTGPKPPVHSNMAQNPSPTIPLEPIFEIDLTQPTPHNLNLPSMPALKPIRVLDPDPDRDTNLDPITVPPTPTSPCHTQSSPPPTQTRRDLVSPPNPDVALNGNQNLGRQVDSEVSTPKSTTSSPLVCMADLVFVPITFSAGEFKGRGGRGKRRGGRGNRRLRGSLKRNGVFSGDGSASKKVALENDRFSVESAYMLLLEIETRRLASPSRAFPVTVAEPKKFWRRLWSLLVPPRVKVLAWRICTEAVPTLDKLARLQGEVDTRCAACGAVIETVKHIFLDCQFARLAWAVSNFPWHVVMDWRGGAAEWLFGGLDYGKTQDKAWFVTMCWALWKHRNKQFMEGKGLEASVVVKDAARFLVQYQEVRRKGRVFPPS
ncbi:hypothetical protein Salat_0623000 [Sesamum alatum]|uniref:Reverse transcriptase zinc-binding domain-containing protein n=1 Tax=Sesamum alatum TaxID=300844 RepID=A0AAE1YR34_9LAMI|nr:hypothetical protein Salat_0623000 [Sesamum alatum]